MYGKVQERSEYLELKGRTAVVTGAGAGIGRAIARALAGAGCNVGLADIEEAAVQRVAEEISGADAVARTYRVDVTREADVVALAEQAWRDFGSVEVLINNAGILSRPGPLLGSTQTDYEWVFAVNVGGMLNGIRVFGNRFANSASHCWIVNTGSEQSLGVPIPNGGLYTASKHALLGLTDVLRRELPPNVGISILCPGFVDTTLWRSTERRPEQFGGPGHADAAGAMLMKLGMPAEEVAACVLQGLRDETFYMLSHPHVVDLARERWNELEAAFAAQAPRRDGDTRYAMPNVLARLAQATRAGKD